MRTTVTLSDEMMQELLNVTGTSNMTQAVSTAVGEYLRRQQLEKLRALRGKSTSSRMKKSKRPTCRSSTVKVADLCPIDTSAWADFFRGHEPLASAVDTLLADGRAALCGIVELEIRQALSQREEDLLNLLGATVRLTTTEEDYAQAGELLADLRRGGMTLPATDGLIAQVALRHGVSLLENDQYFKHIKTLKRSPWRVKGNTR